MKKSKCILLGILALLCLMPDVAFAQTLTVEGTVTDETGEPLIGVSVIVQGRGTGGVTDLDGHYRIPSVAQGATLEFSYVGYLTQQRRAQGRTINVTMQPDTQTLEEVVVIAYGQQKKVTITGAVQAVGGEELLKSPVADVGNALHFDSKALPTLVLPSSDNEERNIQFSCVKPYLKFSRKFRLKSQARGLEKPPFIENFRENFRDSQNEGEIKVQRAWAEASPSKVW